MITFSAGHGPLNWFFSILILEKTVPLFQSIEIYGFNNIMKQLIGCLRWTPWIYQ
jgi:hypothetical protein